ncbi:two-component sensor histidine kinase [Streptomyces sp. ISL-22]|uniref:sensor histidine kinase n=1 Tax=unclassified Streptomyces TaxID=2593676 RepID=UPI001BEB62F6|nr:MULTISPECIES: histidine kinase [unclassified Streptomyces]MBT2423215.1 two-component sensor histidine kinase [Streptomyces sp. ISL-24]MBT2434419.1 two-component sensor histidine kinase [Streptomyces sp. ISL-22]
MVVRLPRPHRFDLCAALAGLLGGLLLWGVGLAARPAGEPIVLLEDRWPILLPLAVTAGCEAMRRTLPRTALLVGWAAVTVDTVTQGNLVTVLMFTDLVYAAVVYGPPPTARRVPWISGLLTVAGTIVPVAVWRVPEALLIGVIIGLVALMPALTGWIVRNHRDAAEAARLRAEQTALLAEMDRAQAVTSERARMARELHDMVANHLSAIAIHSTAALSLDDPKTSREALSVIRENSVEGLSEMRRLIGILRDSSGDTEPVAAPTLDGLGALVAGARTNGLDVTLDAAHGTVPAPVELAAYRIVQESLTNALKHASPGRVTVALAQRDGSLTVTVTSPFGDRDGPRAPGSGAGLVGMRERVALLGGTFEAGPVRDPDSADGKIWTVRATLPVSEGDRE